MAVLHSSDTVRVRLKRNQEQPSQEAQGAAGASAPGSRDNASRLLRPQLCTAETPLPLSSSRWGHADTWLPWQQTPNWPGWHQGLQHYWPSLCFLFLSVCLFVCFVCLCWVIYSGIQNDRRDMDAENVNRDLWQLLLSVQLRTSTKHLYRHQ